MTRWANKWQEFSIAIKPLLCIFLRSEINQIIYPFKFRKTGTERERSGPFSLLLSNTEWIGLKKVKLNSAKSPNVSRKSAHFVFAEKKSIAVRDESWNYLPVLGQGLWSALIYKTKDESCTILHNQTTVFTSFPISVPTKWNFSLARAYGQKFSNLLHGHGHYNF